MGGVCKERFE
uniref:Uncharacterized protein n=1 Tax=Arundo donax TaxID=35708 RepID=A0A0A9SPM4_ARUDO